ncbi:MAG: glycosyltransferase, partial [Bacteroidota bacterium]
SIQFNITHLLRNRFGTTHYIADADAVKHVMVNEDKIDEKKISVIPIGVENDSKEFEENARRKTRAVWNVSPDTVVIGNVARLTEFKGHKYLLQAIVEVVNSSTGVLFPIIGDGELMDELQRQATSLHIEKYVRFLGFQDNLNELYPAFDIYTHSSVELAAEAFPIAILRALATGLPVVCTKVGGIDLMVEDGVSGYLVKPEDPKALAESLVKVIRDKKLVMKMGQASFELFKKKFHAAAMAERVEKVYMNALQRNNPQSFPPNNGGISEKSA